MRYKLWLFIIGVAGWLAPTLAFAQVNFSSSNLPIVVIDTEGQVIPDEPKINVHMGIIWNADGQRNYLSDPFNHYDGRIGIEIRGSSSQMFPKKQYGFETWDSTGEDINVSLLGMPEESDWILYAPYSDKSLMRNVLTYDIARRMGRYASRTYFCELVLNGQYMGIYVLMEKIKRDKNRVDIKKLDPDDVNGIDLTGGYIIKIDKPDPDDNGWFSPFPPYPGASHLIQYLYEEPAADEIVTVQQAYIQNYIYGIEGVFFTGAHRDPFNGYYDRIDVGSFIDFMLVNEIARNVDGYRISTFMYKDRDDRGGKWTMGPVWDFNLGFGNANYYGASNIAGWQYQLQEPNDTWQVPFYWDKLVDDPVYKNRLIRRWRELRSSFLHPDSLEAWVDMYADSISEARIRNFQRWPILGVWVWPNNYVGQTYAEELNYLKGWIELRALWMDLQFGFDFTTVDWADTSAINFQGNAQTAYTIALSEIVLTAANYDSFTVISENGQLAAEISNGSLHLNAPTDGIWRFKLSAFKDGEQRELSPSYHFRAGVTGLPAQTEVIPETFALRQNYPNPFNGSTLIEYYLPVSTGIRLEIFNTAGQRVRLLSTAVKTAGWHFANWHGRDDAGNSVTSGIYFYRLQWTASGSLHHLTRKLLFVK